MKYAVVKAGGQQFKVSEGEILEIAYNDKVQANDAYTFDEVLLFVDGDTKKVGTPTIAGATVTGTVVDHIKKDKLRVSLFKAKARYRKTVGFRAKATKVKIEKIVA